MVTMPLELDLNDHLRVLARRKFQFLIPFAIVLLVAMALAFLLPTRYRSEATLLIERQTIPNSLVAPTVTGFVQEHIQLITQRILTHENLQVLAEKHDLYPEVRKRDPREAMNLISKDFSIEMLDVKASDPNESNGSREATIAFKIAFTAHSAEAAKAVTQELAERYLKENEKHRLAKSQKVAKFLEEEAEKLGVEIKQQESALADFKRSRLNNLPEVVELNRSLFEKADENITATRDRIRELENRIDSFGAELAVTPVYKDVKTEDGGEILNSQDRMNSLVAQYVRATSRYSAKHPDVIRLSREIRTLADQTGNSGRADELMAELIRQQEALRQAEQKYGSAHPDVVQLQKAVSSLESGFLKTLTLGGEKESGVKPDNPTYVALLSQKESAEASLKREQGKLSRYESKLDEYEVRLIESPVVQSQYDAMQRELQSNVNKYNDLKNKQLQARLAEELESGDGGERFSMASPAYLPKLPDSPNRVGILLLGLLLAGISGIVVVALAEYMDKAVYDAKTIAHIFGAPPLVVIPRIQYNR